MTVYVYICYVYMFDYKIYYLQQKMNYINTIHIHIIMYTILHKHIGK